MSHNYSFPSDLVLPEFGLIVPTEWMRVDPSDEVAVNRISQRIVELLPGEEKASARQDVLDYWRTLTRLSVTQYFTSVSIEGNEVIIKVLVCSVGRFDPEPNQNFQDRALNLFKSLDSGWDVPLPIWSIHDYSFGEYLRSERLIYEPGKWLWNASRQVQYLYEHPKSSVYALLTCLSPNVDLLDVLDDFDAVAETFFWLPS